LNLRHSQTMNICPTKSIQLPAINLPSPTFLAAMSQEF
jgi:hypothetical protein